MFPVGFTSSNSSTVTSGPIVERNPWQKARSVGAVQSPNGTSVSQAETVASRLLEGDVGKPVHNAPEPVARARHGI
jgi:hypothetical protein